MTCFYQFFNPVKAVLFNIFYFLHAFDASYYTPSKPQPLF